MCTLSILEYENGLREADRFREILKVEVGQAYQNRLGNSVIIVGETTVRGWVTSFFVDSEGRRYDKFGYSYGSGVLPPSNEDLVALSMEQ
jgi:hypothetical protein